jgi:hypothetical protein
MKVKRSTIIHKTLATFVVELLSTAVLSQAQVIPVTYDAAANFSTTNNPTTVWTYGYEDSSGDFAQFPINNGNTNTPSWCRALDFPNNLPTVLKNVSGHVWTDGSGNIIQIDQMALHPGNSSDAAYAVLRFTAPITGLYTVTARFSGLFSIGNGTTSDVYIDLNKTTRLFDSSVRGYAAEASYTSPFLVTALKGDTIDFIVSNGGNGFEGDLTGLAATVTLVRSIAVLSIYTAVEICWDTATGKTYQVECASTVYTNVWTEVGEPVLGDGGLKCLLDSTRGQEQKFYRVLTVE